MNATFDDLRRSVEHFGRHTPEYVEKQLHPVPRTSVVCRETFLLEQSLGKVVLDIGASGPMHAEITKAARKCYGMDLNPSPGVIGINLDEPLPLPQFDGVELVICGEVLEHLSNPGWLLSRLREQYPCRLIVTVPNAFSDIARKHMENGVENVNADHVAWYSWRTFKTLSDRFGYTIKQFFAYNGRERFSEGLIFVLE